jgi:hypothetical protein
MKKYRKCAVKYDNRKCTVNFDNRKCAVKCCDNRNEIKEMMFFRNVIIENGHSKGVTIEILAVLVEL